jgi:signal peptidase II
LTASSVSNGAASAGRPLSRRVAPLIVGGVVLLDQLSKSWVVAHYSDAPLSIVGDDIEIHVARNSGGAFSTFTNATVVLAVLAIGLTIWLVRTLRKTTDRLTIVALALVLGGAIGNLCDRILRSPGVLRGHVVDYFRVGSFPSFNVADSAITIGAILLILLSFRKPEPESQPEPRPDAGPEPVA